MDECYLTEIFLCANNNEDILQLRTGRLFGKKSRKGTLFERIGRKGKGPSWWG